MKKAFGQAEDNFDTKVSPQSTASGESAQKNGNECYKCGGSGHWAKYCNESRVVKKNSDAKCFNCKKSGHWSRDCPEPRRQKEDQSFKRQKSDFD